MKIKENYIEWLENENKSQITIKGYSNNLRIVSEYFWNKKFEDITIDDLKTLTRKDIKDFRYSLDQKGNKAATIRLRLDSLLSVFEYLRDDDLITKEFDLRSDIKEIRKKVKDSKKEVPDLLTHEDIGEIFNTIRRLDGKFKLRRQLMTHLLLSYGLRRQEITDLEIDYFDFEEDKFYVLGKGAKGRVLSLIPETKELISHYLEDRETLSYSNSEFLFITRKGGKMTTSCLSQEFNKIIKELETNKKISPHKLRALFATEMHESGVDPLVIQAMMGHSSLNTTQRYIKSYEKAKMSAMQNNPFKDLKII